MHNLIYRKILTLPIAEPTKTEVLALWKKGEVHDILDKLATYELQNQGIIKQWPSVNVNDLQNAVFAIEIKPCWNAVFAMR